MLDTVQPEQQNKTNYPKQQGKEKTFRQKIMLDTLQPVHKKYREEKRKKHKVMLDCSQSYRQKQIRENNQAKINLDNVQTEQHI